MPRLLRVTLAIIAFTVFFVGSLLIGAVFFPLVLLLSLGNRERHRAFCTRFVSKGYGTFLFFLKSLGLIEYGAPLELPESLRGRPFVLVANHPSLIDVLFFLHWFEGTTSVVKGEWHRNFFFAPVLRSLNYVSNQAPGDDPFTGALERMVAHVEAGFPLVVFPEGTRSDGDSMHRFKRGAFEIAVRTGVPVLPAFIGTNPAILQKGAALDLKATGQYSFELFDVIEASEYNDAKKLRDAVEAQIRTRFDEFLIETGRAHAVVSDGQRDVEEKRELATSAP